MPNPHEHDRTAPLIRKKEDLTPEQYAHQRKMLIATGLIMVVGMALAAGVFYLLG